MRRRSLGQRFSEAVKLVNNPASGPAQKLAPDRKLESVAASNSRNWNAVKVLSSLPRARG